MERAVTARAKEVAQYLDPAVTAPVAVAAVPDAAYEVLKRAHADAWSKGVVIVPYSSALPIVLFLYSLVQRFGDAADVQSSLAEVASALEAMEAVIENKCRARRDHAHERRRRVPVEPGEGPRVDRARPARARPPDVPAERRWGRPVGGCRGRSVRGRQPRVDISMQTMHNYPA